MKTIQLKYAQNVEIEINNKFIINAIYKSPKQNRKEFIEELKKWICHEDIKNKEIIIVGDININTLDDNSDTQAYIETLSSNGIMNTINKITREEILNNRLTTSCIDHINVRTQCSFTAAVIQEKISDHYFIFAKINQSKFNDTHKNNIVQIITIDDDKINNFIQNFNWDTIIEKNENNSIEILYNDFVEKFQELYRRSEKTIKIKKKYIGNTWITQEIRELIKMKNRKWKQLKRNSGNNVLQREYKNMRNHLNNKITQAKRTEFKNKFETYKGDMRNTWNTINKLRNKKKNKNNEEIILTNFQNSNKSPLTLANEFNNKFVLDISHLKNTKEILNKTIIYNNVNNDDRNKFKVNYIGRSHLWKIIKEMKTNKGPGYDRIRPKDIKTNLVYLQDLLIIKKIVHIFNFMSFLFVCLELSSNGTQEPRYAGR
uniref:Endonuclease/exonuclease/phosphatase domain-containing protein n=1 Tax=Cacopsylla melanoneura TaxID=428564 RepID=A0A8D9EZR2_9HEMI